MRAEAGAAEEALAETLPPLLRRAARQEILPRFRRLAAGEVRAKSGPLDLVTDADEAAERLIAEELRARFPGCLVVGEEAATRDPSLLSGLAEAPLAFVVDPVDGTANFAAGLPLFGVMAAAFRRGEAVAGWIHDPLGDDTAWAFRGSGAWLSGGEGREAVRLRVAEPAKPAAMVAAVSFGYLPQPAKDRAAARLTRFAATVQLRCAAHEYRMLAGGHAHAALYNRLLPWDHAPGWLIHAEAGGHAARFDGSPYDPARQTGGGLILAPDRAGWEAVRSALLGD